MASDPTADATPEPPQQSPPAYDLKADQDRIASQFKQELGKGARTAVVGDVFVLGAPPSSGAVESSLPFVERVLEALLNNRFRTRPERAISVYLFPHAGSYDHYCRAAFQEPCISIYGFFSPSRRALIMNIGLGIGTLSHELVHPILEADFPRAPTWINEGIASLYEAPVLPKRGEIHGRKNWRYPRLQSAISSPREKKLATLDALFIMTDSQFRARDEDLHYAMARYACQWLDQNNKLWPFYQAWRDHYDTDPTGDGAFTSVVGKSPAEASEDWTRWVIGLASAG